MTDAHFPSSSSRATEFSVNEVSQAKHRPQIQDEEPDSIGVQVKKSAVNTPRHDGQKGAKKPEPKKKKQYRPKRIIGKRRLAKAMIDSVNKSQNEESGLRDALNEKRRELEELLKEYGPEKKLNPIVKKANSYSRSANSNSSQVRSSKESAVSKCPGDMSHGGGNPGGGPNEDGGRKDGEHSFVKASKPIVGKSRKYESRFSMTEKLDLSSEQHKLLANHAVKNMGAARNIIEFILFSIVLYLMTVLFLSPILYPVNYVSDIEFEAPMFGDIFNWRARFDDDVDFINWDQMNVGGEKEIRYNLYDRWYNIRLFDWEKEDGTHAEINFVVLTLSSIPIMILSVFLYLEGCFSNEYERLYPVDGMHIDIHLKVKPATYSEIEPDDRYLSHRGADLQREVIERAKCHMTIRIQNWKHNDLSVSSRSIYRNFKKYAEYNESFLIDPGMVDQFTNHRSNDPIQCRDVIWERIGVFAQGNHNMNVRSDDVRSGEGVYHNSKMAAYVMICSQKAAQPAFR